MMYILDSQPEGTDAKCHDYGVRRIYICVYTLQINT